MIKKLLLTAAAALPLCGNVSATAPNTLTLPDPNAWEDMQTQTTARAEAADVYNNSLLFGYYDEDAARGHEENNSFIVYSTMIPLENGMYFATIPAFKGQRFIIGGPEGDSFMRFKIKPEDYDNLRFDNYGICEITLDKYVANDNELADLNLLPYTYYHDLYGNNALVTDFYFDPATGKLYVDDRSTVFIAGDFTWSKTLTFDNRNDFDLFSYKIKDNGKIVSVPEGEFRFSLQNFRKVYNRTWDLTAPATLDISGGVGSILTNDHQGAIEIPHTLYGCEEVTVSNWDEYGNAFINYYMVIPMDSPKLYLYPRGPENEVRVIEPTGTGGNRMMFEFDDKPGNLYYDQTIYYSLVPPAYNRLSLLAFLSSRSYDVPGGITNYGHTVKLSNIPYTAYLSFGGGQTFQFPQTAYYSDSNSFIETKVNVDLAWTKSIMWTVAETSLPNLRNIYSIWNWNQYLDPYGTVICPPRENGYESVLLDTRPDCDLPTYSFDIVRPDNYLAVPLHEGEITYDRNGYWEGGFDLINPYSTSEYIAPAKWVIPSCPGKKISLALDEQNRKIMIHSAEHFDGYFVHLMKQPYEVREWVTFDNLPEMMANAIYRNEAGDICGEITVDPSIVGFRLRGGVNSQNDLLLSQDFDGNRTVTDNSTIQVPQLTDSSVNHDENYIKINVSQPTTLAITVKDTDDPSCKMVHVTASPAGIENVTADAESALSLPVRYYNLQGQPIAAPIPGTPCLRVSGTTATKILGK